MNLREAIECWDELGDIDEWSLVAFVRQPDASADDSFPYDIVPVVEVVVDDEEREVTLALPLDASSEDECPVRIGAVRPGLRTEVRTCGDYDVYVSTPGPEDEDGYVSEIHSPVVGVAKNAEQKVFAVVKWFDGVDEIGLWPSA